MAEPTMQLEDWLDDLCVRFIINLPEEDLSSVARICFQVEEAQWFYEDFIRPLDPALPSMSLRTFCLRIFQHCPLLAHFSVENHTKAFEEFLEYKTRIPVRGAIMLNHEMDSAVLVKGWKKGANWGFPGGKINKDEDDLDCAIREVYEETGLDLRRAGLVPKDGRPKYIELPIKNHQVRLYVFRDVPMDTNFQPQTRKEISKIQWYSLSELPTFRRRNGQNNDASAATGANKFYMVAPFMVPLKKWVGSQKKFDERRIASGQTHLRPTVAVEETVTEDDAPVHHVPVAPSQEPAINTLDGATRELQRLLKMQPPNQGVQPPQPNIEDKGSALLSMLQSKNAGPALGLQPNLNGPHTPLDLAVGELPQPPNPHHHTNQHGLPHGTHQPPPSFPLPPNQGAGSWDPHQTLPRMDQSLGQNQQALNHQRYSNNQAALVHPQPLPPQVQTSMLNKTPFQEAPTAHPTAPAQQPHFAAHQNPAQPAHMQYQAQTAQQQAKPMLNGQSMALLNAFKRDTPPSTSTQQPAPDENHSAVQAGYAGSGRPSFYGQHPAPQNISDILSNPSKLGLAQKSPPGVAGPGAGQPADQHRSALLGMFKKEAPETIPAQHSGPSQARLGNQTGKDLLLQLQGQTRAPQASASPGTKPGLSMNSLSIQPRPAQPGSQAADAGLNTVPGQGPSSAQSTGDHPTQPIRILQRGQNLQQPSPGDPSPAAKTFPYASQAQPAPSQAVNPPSAASDNPPGVQNQRPGAASSDQKRQLLSLFGKQQGSPSAPAAGPSAHELPAHRGSTGSGDAPRSRLPSLASGSGERRGSQTPISPADQSFLLGYLQSVTNNASR